MWILLFLLHGSSCLLWRDFSCLLHTLLQCTTSRSELVRFGIKELTHIAEKLIADGHNQIGVFAQSGLVFWAYFLYNNNKKITCLCDSSG